MAKPMKSTDKTILLQRLKQARKAAGYTQVAFAAKLGLQRDTYAKYETRNVIPVDTARAAAEILQKPFEYFVAADFLNEKFPTSVRDDISPLTGTVPVTVVGAVQAGTFREALEWAPERQERLAIPVGVPYSDKPLQGLR
jgi:transcriptional regulator with XRE-family HTH domain